MFLRESTITPGVSRRQEQQEPIAKQQQPRIEKEPKERTRMRLAMILWRTRVLWNGFLWRAGTKFSRLLLCVHVQRILYM